MKKVIQYPDPFLHEPTLPVHDIEGEETQKIIKCMIETMHEYGGVGLAANQIGYDKSIIIYDQTEDRSDTRVLINPEITFKSKEKQKSKEGCLCLPGIFIPINRFRKVTVKGYDKHGIQLEIQAEYQLANILQHEIDHLHGILFIDHLSKMQREVFRKRLRRIKKI